MQFIGAFLDGNGKLSAVPHFSCHVKRDQYLHMDVEIMTLILTSIGVYSQKLSKHQLIC